MTTAREPPKVGRPDLLTPKQLEATDALASARFVLLDGGSRSGKTFAIVRAIIYRALRAPGSRHGIFRYRYNAVRASIWRDTFPKVMRLCFPGEATTDRRQEGFVEFPNGSTIWFFGLEDPARVDKILGLEFATLFGNEASQIPYASYTTALTRLAQKTILKPRVWLDCNPTSTAHWLYRTFVEKRDPATRMPLTNPDEYVRLSLNPRDNLRNLTPEYVAYLEMLPERQRRRFLEGQYTSDNEGALWPLELLERCRCAEAELPVMRRVVIGVDPSGAAGPEDKRSDETGIVACGLGADGRGYVLGDYSLRASADAWPRAVVAAYRKHEADAVIAERNFGGDMVRGVLHAHDADLPVRVITASRGKVVRAEPIAALYEQGKIFHLERLPQLEDQLASFSIAGYLGDRSPDRADAAVHALSALMLTHAETRPSRAPEALALPSGGSGFFSGGWKPERLGGGNTLR